MKSALDASPHRIKTALLVGKQYLRNVGIPHPCELGAGRKRNPGSAPNEACWSHLGIAAEGDVNFDFKSKLRGFTIKRATHYRQTGCSYTRYLLRLSLCWIEMSPSSAVCNLLTSTQRCSLTLEASTLYIRVHLNSPLLGGRYLFPTVVSWGEARKFPSLLLAAGPATRAVGLKIEFHVPASSPVCERMAFRCEAGFG
jgi:hypothetical protein